MNIQVMKSFLLAANEAARQFVRDTVSYQRDGVRVWLYLGETGLTLRVHNDDLEAVIRGHDFTLLVTDAWYPMTIEHQPLVAALRRKFKERLVAIEDEHKAADALREEQAATNREVNDLRTYERLYAKYHGKAPKEI